MIKAIILMLVCVSMVQSAGTAPTGVSYITYSDPACETVTLTFTSMQNKALELALADKCADGKVTNGSNVHENGKCLKVDALSYKLTWTGGCGVASGSTQAAATAFIAIGALAFL